MFAKSIRILFVVLSLSLVTAGVAFAESGVPEGGVRYAGLITDLDLPGKAFLLRTPHSAEIRVHVTGATTFRSPGGEVESFDDLEEGMRVAVAGKPRGDGAVIAEAIVAFARPDLLTFRGIVQAVEPAQDAFTLETAQGEVLRLKVVERTRFRSPNGEIHGLEDMEPGMAALVAAVRTPEDELTAVAVAVGRPDDLRDRVFRAQGTITNVIPGRGVFELQTRKGETFTFQVDERTRFKSRDGSIQSIHDLKAGMLASVSAIKQEDGANRALLVAAGDPEDRPGRPVIDRKAAGKILSVGASSFTIQTREGEQLIVQVSSATRFRSRDGNVDGLDDLEPGMITLVALHKAEDGGWVALWVGVGRHSADGRTSGSRPARPVAPGPGGGLIDPLRGTGA